MTPEEMECDALQCWDLLRTACREEIRNVEHMPNMEVWVFAYCAGAQMGADMERKECECIADFMGAGAAAEAIRSREDDDQEDGDD